MDIELMAAVAGISIAAIAVAAPFIAAMKSILNRAIDYSWNLVFVRKEFRGTSGEVIIMYLNDHAKAFNVGVETFTSQSVWVRKQKKNLPILHSWKQESYTTYLLRGVPILIRPSTSTKNQSPECSGRLDFVFIRGTVDLEKLIIAATLHYHRRLDSDDAKGDTTPRFRVEKYFGSVGGSGGLNAKDLESPDDAFQCNDWTKTAVGWAAEELGYSKETAPGLQSYSMSPEASAVVNDIRFWKSHKEWYEARGISWRRGYLLHGAPGCGKTSLIRGIAEELDLPVFVFDLVSMTNRDLHRAWENVLERSPCIIVFEDFDSVFNGRVAAPGVHVTFDAVLNSVDGIQQNNGTLLFITTNHLKTVDSALGAPTAEGASRPGRIDVVAELGDLDLNGRIKIAQRILKDDKWAGEVARAYAKGTPAQFQEHCIQLALHSLWVSEKQEGKQQAS